MSGEDTSRLLDRARGSLLGTLIGDALGRPVEGSLPGERLRAAVLRRVAAPRAWSHSDDGEMMLGVADALRERGEVDAHHLLGVLARGHEPARGYGKGTRAAFRAWEAGAGPELASRALFADGSRGNGAAVRVAPVAASMVDADEPSFLAAVRTSGSATHAHEEALAGAALIAVAVRCALRAEHESEVMTKAAAHARPPFEFVYGAAGVPVPGVLAVESVPSALWAFARASRFEDAVVRAVSLGGDTDSVAAMTGAVAGAFYGASQIPARMESALERGAVGRVDQFIEWMRVR